MPIPARTLIEISPILLFPHSEYQTHGRFTQLDHYTYCWKDGYALALGLGSMFNHDKQPNVGFMRDFENQLIRYVTLRAIAVDEELCISYGANLWFEDASMDHPADSLSDNDNNEDWLMNIEP
ncbi:protein methyltransferase [Hesseltinella vesiculosa]|uniref:Protein methyltransferase n=1 Tax=Hesseltinella vesiculosa TaxID=101127 RepID=A0A1X2G8D9_9FUNG|nr:protein methyltransferase [Hesseltinella vesiculosa]